MCGHVKKNSLFGIPSTLSFEEKFTFEVSHLFSGIHKNLAGVKPVRGYLTRCKPVAIKQLQEPNKNKNRGKEIS